METGGYVTLTRQSGLMREMQVVANNIANLSTAGFRREGVVFEEYLQPAGDAGSVSMASGNARVVDLTQSGFSTTGGTFDFAIQGDGFFAVNTPQGQRLTRAGSFTPSAEGVLVNPEGHALLDAGGTPVTIPAGQIALAADGTLSANGQPFAKIGLWQPTDPLSLRHEGGTLFDGGPLEPAEGASLMQGMLEDSNVEPVTEVARMIEVQRAYELGQGFLDREDERQRGVIQTLGR